MSEKDNIEEAKQTAEEAAKRLFGNRTKEQEEALRNVKTIGSPEKTFKSEEETFGDEEGDE